MSYSQLIAGAIVVILTGMIVYGATQPVHVDAEFSDQPSTLYLNSYNDDNFSLDVGLMDPSTTAGFVVIHVTATGGAQCLGNCNLQADVNQNTQDYVAWTFWIHVPSTVTNFAVSYSITNDAPSWDFGNSFFGQYVPYAPTTLIYNQTFPGQYDLVTT